MREWRPQGAVGAQERRSDDPLAWYADSGRDRLLVRLSDQRRGPHAFLHLAADEEDTAVRQERGGVDHATDVVDERMRARISH